VNNPEDASAGTRKVPFSRMLYIEQDDFREHPPAKFFRLAPGQEVRLRYAYFITCREVIKNEKGDIVEVRCTYDPATRAATRPTEEKSRGPSTGFRRRMRLTHRSAYMITCLTYATPMMWPKVSTIKLILILNPGKLSKRRVWSRALKPPRRAAGFNSNAWAIFLRP